MGGGLSMRGEIAKAVVQEKYPGARVTLRGGIGVEARFFVEVAAGDGGCYLLSNYCVSEDNAWISADRRIEKLKNR